MLWGKVLRSPMPHARIVAIDTTAAAALPGVHAVLVGADLPPDTRVGRNMRDMPILARYKVRFAGEKVAAVAAETEEIAEAAVALIQVEYEELPTVFDPLAAIEPDAPLVQDPADVRAWATKEQVVPDYPNGVSAPAWGASSAEVEAALARADRVIEHVFHTPIQHQVYLEPHVCLVEIDQAGVAQIWASNKAPLLLARYLKEGLGLQRDQIDIHMLPLGGDFGGKGSFMDIPLAYLLAKASGRPVKMAMSYVDELIAGNPRHSATLRVRSGVNRDGKIVARLVQTYFNSGAYAAFKPDTSTVLPGYKRGAVGPYHIAVHRAECHMVYTNTVPCGHMRSPGEAQVAYALEAHTDLIARELGMDSLELRRRNGSHHPRPSEDGGESIPPRIDEVLDVAAKAIGLYEPRPDDVGRGIALIEFSTNPGLYSAIMRVAADGRVTLQTPIIDNGAGMLTVFKQIVAEELGVPVSEVAVEQSITGIADDRGIGGSRTTRMEGLVITNLARQVRDRLAALLAAEYGLEADTLEPVAGGFTAPDGRTFTLAEAASLATDPVEEVYVLQASQNTPTAVYMAMAAEVAVDRETGQVTPRRLVSVQEVGRVINPLLFETQVEGGALQGVGYALMEQVVVQDGRVVNVNLHEYKVPTMGDVPPIQSISVGHDLRLGITPIGEGPNAGLPAAIVNAVVDVVGPFVFDLPLAPEVVRERALGSVAAGT
jgi:CO/xanthine dehydrogenase Mo-binding subunit